MKSQLQNQETRLSVQPQTQPQVVSAPGAESSRIAAAISRILLVHRATSAEKGATAGAAASEPRRDATPVEWALRMMF